jgi:cell division protein FtsB
VNLALPDLREPSAYKLWKLPSSGGTRYAICRPRILAGAAIGLLTAWMAYCAAYTPNGWMAFQQKRADCQQLLQENQQLEKGNEELERRVRALKTDPRTIEQIAREELGLVRPGEIVYRIAPGKPAPSTTPQPPARLGQKYSRRQSGRHKAGRHETR